MSLTSPRCRGPARGARARGRSRQCRDGVLRLGRSVASRGPGEGHRRGGPLPGMVVAGHRRRHPDRRVLRSGRRGPAPAAHRRIRRFAPAHRTGQRLRQAPERDRRRGLVQRGCAVLVPGKLAGLPGRDQRRRADGHQRRAVRGALHRHAPQRHGREHADPVVLQRQPLLRQRVGAVQDAGADAGGGEHAGHAVVLPLELVQQREGELRLARAAERRDLRLQRHDERHPLPAPQLGAAAGRLLRGLESPTRSGRAPGSWHCTIPRAISSRSRRARCRASRRPPRRR